jgi:hypothetical protein
MGLVALLTGLGREAGEVCGTKLKEGSIFTFSFGNHLIHIFDFDRKKAKE